MLNRYLLTLTAAVSSILLPAPLHADDGYPVPLIRTHSHNDYEHTRPLFDALDQGFFSVEADVWLVDGALLVAHERDHLDPAKTLQKLYLDPLRDRAKKLEGHIYPGVEGFTLLIDIKNTGAETYKKINEVLKQYPEMFTSFTDDATHTKAVTVVISGDCPRKVILSESPRLASIDGHTRDLDGPYNKNQMPWVSDNWLTQFTWLGFEAMPEAQLQKLRDLVAKAHAKGIKIRFWSIPYTPAVWQILWDNGVDYLNTDDLVKMKEFILSQKK